MSKANRNYNNSFEETIHFSIKKMEDIYEETSDIMVVPHRHNYYTIIWPIKSAKGIHIIDFKKYHIKRNGIFFIRPGQVHHLKTDHKPMGYVILFSNDFLNKSKIEKSFIDNLKVYNSYLHNEPLIIDKEKEIKLLNIVDSIYSTLSSHSQYRDEALGAYLKLFLIECTSVCDAEIKIQDSKSKFMVEEFKILVEQKFMKEHKVKYYSDKLVISPGHLNQTLKKELGITAKKYIQDRITLEAKRLILYSNRSAKRSAYELGFSDPHHFSKFIKNQTGFSVSQLAEKFKY